MLRYRPEIDGLRAIAIVAVVLFHSGLEAFSGGYAGVDVFFVISGYLITSIVWREQSEGRFTFFSFYERRARRILPALFFMLIAVTIASATVLLPDAFIEYGKVLDYTVLFIANFRLAGASGYFDTWSATNPLLHMWSLAVEEQFYFIWPVLLLVGMAKLSRQRFIALTIALAVVSFASSVVLVEVMPRSAFFHLPSRGWELLAGSILSLGIVPPVPNRKAAEGLSLVGLGLIAFGIASYTKDTAFPGVAALAPVLGAAFVIHGTTQGQTFAGRLLSWRPVVFVGLISYSLYLWHWPVFALALGALFRPLTPVETAMCLGAATFLSILSWRFVERPFRRAHKEVGLGFASAARFRLYPKAAAAMTAAVILIIAGSVFQKTKGLPARFSPELRAMMEGNRSKDHFSTVDGDQFSRKCAGLPNDLMECHIGSATTGKPARVVLWGDSHALALMPAIAAAFDGSEALYRLGCLPVFGITWVNALGKEIGAACAQAKENAFQTMEKLRPDLVIVAARWGVVEEMPYGSERVPHSFFVASNTDEKSRKRTHDVFAENFEKTVKRLTDFGAKVLIVSQVPEFKVNVAACTFMAFHFSLDTRQCATIARSEVEQRHAFFSKVFRDIAIKNANVTTLWPLPYFCDAEVCYGNRDGELLYWDSNHINAVAAQSLVPALRAASIDALVKQAAAHQTDH